MFQYTITVHPSHWHYIYTCIAFVAEVSVFRRDKLGQGEGKSLNLQELHIEDESGFRRDSEHVLRSRDDDD